MADTVIVHSPDHLRAVFDVAANSGCPIRAVIAEWAGVAYGALYWLKALDLARDAAPDAPVTVALHCGDDAAGAAAALREGWKQILFGGPPVVRAKIADIAAQQSATVIEPPDASALDLGRHPEDAAAAVAAWLAKRCK